MALIREAYAAQEVGRISDMVEAVHMMAKIERTITKSEDYSESPSPPPVVPLSAGPPVAPNEFINPGDWGYEFHEGLSQREIRFRKKAAQIKRGRMG